MNSSVARFPPFAARRCRHTRYVCQRGENSFDEIGIGIDAAARYRSQEVTQAAGLAGEAFVLGRRGATGLASMSTFMIPTPAMPSARQWCRRKISPLRLPFSPCTKVRSHSGCCRSITVLRIFPASVFNSASEPCLSVTSRTWSADVEGWVVFPARKANIKRRGHHTLEVAGNQRQLRLDKLDASLERDLTLKHADTGHVEGHALAFEMEENGVTPGKAVTLL